MATEYPHRLAQELYNQFSSIRFGSDVNVAPLISQDLVERVRQSPVGGLDFRSKVESQERIVSVFEGLEFDPNNIRSQAFVLGSEQEIMGIMTFVIAPKSVVIDNRYLIKQENGVVVADLPTICRGELPEYVIIPAWTKVNPNYLNQFVLPGLRALIESIHTIERNSPENTWIEAAAGGHFPNQRKEELKPIIDLGVGTYVDSHDLPFDLDIIGKNNNGSSSTVKMAPFLGLKRVENVGAISHLGPVFHRRVN